MKPFGPTLDVDDDGTARVRKDTCVWCGKKLTWKTHLVYRTVKRVDADGIVRSYQEDTGKRKRVHAATGPYGDGAFCSLTCGYLFGCEQARRGHRLIPKR